jgi:hypothetical protein
LLLSSAWGSESGLGEVVEVPELVMSARGELLPALLPRDKTVPASLTVGFSSDDPASPATPEITRMEIEISRNITLRGSKLPGCSPETLYQAGASARQECSQAYVGDGTVVSEISMYHREPVTVTGHLAAYFYDLPDDRPRILAQVITGSPLPLTYVIPFQVRKMRGSFATSLLVPKRQMTGMRGICAKNHPECFGTPYTLEGVYGHISRLEMTLHRLFPEHGKVGSFVEAHCHASGKRQASSFPLVRVSLDYASGSAPTNALTRKCHVLA